MRSVERLRVISRGGPTKREAGDEARPERERIELRRRKRTQYLGAWIATVVIFAAGCLAAKSFLPSDEGATLAAPPDGVQDFEVASRNHVAGSVQYAQDPPVGGDHNPVGLDCAAYAQPVPNERAVHDLELGAVWITYQPDLSQDDVDVLGSIASDTFILVSPYPGLDSPVVASSWGHQLRLQDVDDERLQQFIRAFREGPDAPELGAPCAGGTTSGAES
jgi:hypothetical protein